MPRRTADQRHADSAPAEPLQQHRPRAATLVALHHPVRAALHRVLELEGPAPVGVLAARRDLAAGSASHHLKVLHRAGLVEPAPELARDTRESWWRAVPVRMSWSTEDFPPGSADHAQAVAAERAVYAGHVAALDAWQRQRHGRGDAWSRAGHASETSVMATREQLEELGRRITDVLVGWSDECRADREARPDAVRRPVMAFAHLFPDVRIES
jgi:DNA-binding transcriptional ArsR family regulator